MDYKYASNYDAAPLGRLTEANKKLIWPGLSYDADKAGDFYSLVEDARFPGGRAVRCLYPEGSYGMKSQFFQIRLKSPQTIANLEWYWSFDKDFSFVTPNDEKHGGGKIGPCINWGEVGGDNAKRGTRCMIWWGCNGSYYDVDHPIFNPSCQDQRSGTAIIQPVVYSEKINTETLYKFRIQMIGGPQGFAKYWLNDQPFAEVAKPHNLMATNTDDVLIDFAHFSGGGSAIYAPTHDSYGRHGGVRYWSGEAYWAAEDGGNGGGGTDEGGGGGTGPTPPDGTSFTVTIDGRKYLVTGSWALELLE